ncbi:Acyclic terpene utilization [Dillenia turbinata]|uniref:Acyclic terpene utilization n=1 Tax=Dillenia turbinata TaxID=194707 RepID=A0AAN8UQM8_9MAGN
MENQDGHELHDCVMKLRENPQRQREKVFIGCGAGFGGDRPLAALKLLQRVKELNYLVLECLAERTLAERYREMLQGGDGFDSRISDWMRLLLPLAMERRTCIITNMGAGAQENVIKTASSLGLNITVAVAYEVGLTKSGLQPFAAKSCIKGGVVSTYLGAAPIVQCLERYQPDVIITSRVADAALFLGPMVYELGWNWDELEQLAQGTLAGHLLECGCQLTGGDTHRDLSFSQLLNLSLPFAEVSFDGKVYVGKADGSGGILDTSTCAEQLLYEVGNPAAYITPDVILDVRDVSFQSLSSCRVLCTGAKPSMESRPNKLLQLVPKDRGWKGWGEISYGGYGSVKRAKAAEFLVRAWVDEIFPGISKHILSYIIGLDSLKITSTDKGNPLSNDIQDVRLRMDGRFKQEQHAVLFCKEFTALYTNGPAGGGGISTGVREEIILKKEVVDRHDIFWCTKVKSTTSAMSNIVRTPNAEQVKTNPLGDSVFSSYIRKEERCCPEFSFPPVCVSPAPPGQLIPLYKVVHSRAGDKGNDLNFSIIPHFPPDIERLKTVITPEWVKVVVSTLMDSSSFPDSDSIDRRNELVNEHVKVEIYEVKGIHSLNIVVRNILDGGVNCSRRIDRHGKTISDLVLSQQVALPP